MLQIFALCCVIIRVCFYSLPSGTIDTIFSITTTSNRFKLQNVQSIKVIELKIQ